MHDGLSVAADRGQLDWPEQRAHALAEVAFCTELEGLKDTRKLGFRVDELREIHPSKFIYQEDKPRGPVSFLGGNLGHEVKVHTLKGASRWPSGGCARERLIIQFGSNAGVAGSLLVVNAKAICKVFVLPAVVAQTVV